MFIQERLHRNSALQCKAPASKFEEQVSGEVTWADEHRIGVAEGVDPEILEGLRQNFQGECTEVGMYLGNVPSGCKRMLSGSCRVLQDRCF